MREKYHHVDFCVVGGGLAGICAAISAARHGVKVALIQDRPMLGGNASSEIRMVVCGARGKNNRETGLIEEILLENLYFNPLRNYSLWDTVLYEKVRFEDNIILLLNCSVNELQMDGSRIKSVRGWQLTTETWHTVKADLFADCSGDSILAPLSGAEYRVGREARSEFDEDIQPDVADKHTMGLSCLIQARETPQPQVFNPPSWAYQYLSDEDLPYREHDDFEKTNFWWIEIGGEVDSIHDAEEIRDELLKIAYGVWDHIKNHGDHGAENWVLDWVGFLPGKRESRRYVGDRILTQNDVRTGGEFDDIVAYGGWTMDDHHPGGMNWEGEPTIFHPAPSPFGIPFRSLYSKNIENLFFAGRNISTTHAALSASRVMATCALLGQAIGSASSIAIHGNLKPRQVYHQSIDELKQILMDDDCWLPGNIRRISDITRNAKLTASSGDPEPLRNGLDRPSGDQANAWSVSPGGWVMYSFPEPWELSGLRLIFDSHLNRMEENNLYHYPIAIEPLGVPKTMVRAYRIEARDQDGVWQPLLQEKNNYQRMRRQILKLNADAIRLYLDSTWGAENCRLFAWDLF